MNHNIFDLMANAKIAEVANSEFWRKIRNQASFGLRSFSSAIFNLAK